MKLPQEKRQYTATPERESHQWADFGDQRHVCPAEHKETARGMDSLGGQGNTTDFHDDYSPAKVSAMREGFTRLDGPPEDSGSLELNDDVGGFCQRSNLIDRN